MIKIVAKGVVKDGCADQLIEAAKEMILKSREEEGNISYTLNQSTEDPNVLTFIECWKDQEAIKKHEASPHFTSSISKVVELCEVPMTAEFYTEIEY